MNSEIRKVVVVVFGCRHEKEFLGRVIKAVNFVLLNKLNPIFIFTGLDAYPQTMGFLSNRVVWEDNSFDTTSNVRNTLETLKTLEINELNLFIVSSWYHIPKIKLLLKRGSINLSRQSFVRSYKGVQLINVVIEPFALLAAYFQFNRRPLITTIKRRLGYDV